ncbi:MAG: hypothetical protein JJV95_06590 [Sulfurospirillum sp.]|nr:hypothetical protein [Sulfurospirillum sp.]MBL0703630.1 hypothetical protein [Sulfurospirillum sp.]
MSEGDINEDFYLCEGIWLDKGNKTLTDEDTKHKLDINNIDDMIIIFKREVEAWLFAPMNQLMNDDKDINSSYRPFKNAIFMLFGIFSYIEKIQRYKDGEPYISGDSKSTKILTLGFKNIFGSNKKSEFGDKKISTILENTRHTMMHSGNIGDKVLLNYDYANANAVTYIGSNKNLCKIELNPYSMLLAIAKDFDEYLKNIKDGATRQDNFKTVFKSVYSDEIKLLYKRENFISLKVKI